MDARRDALTMTDDELATFEARAIADRDRWKEDWEIQPEDVLALVAEIRRLRSPARELALIHIQDGDELGELARGLLSIVR